MVHFVWINYIIFNAKLVYLKFCERVKYKMKKNIKVSLSKALSIGIISIGSLSLGLFLKDEIVFKNKQETYLSSNNEDQISSSTKNKIIGAKNEENFHRVGGVESDYLFEMINGNIPGDDYSKYQTLYFIDLENKNSEMIFNSEKGFQPLFSNYPIFDISEDELKIISNPTKIIDYEYYYSPENNGYYYGAMLLNTNIGVLEEEWVPWVFSFSSFLDNNGEIYLNKNLFKLESVIEETSNEKNINIEDFDIENTKISYAVDYSKSNSYYTIIDNICEEIIIYDENTIIGIEQKSNIIYNSEDEVIDFSNKEIIENYSNVTSKRIINANIIYDKTNIEDNFSIIYEVEDLGIFWVRNNNWTKIEKLEGYKSIIFNTKIILRENKTWPISFVEDASSGVYYPWNIGLDSLGGVNDEKPLMINNNLSIKNLENINNDIFTFYDSSDEMSDEYYLNVDDYLLSNLNGVTDINKKGIYKISVEDNLVKIEMVNVEIYDSEIIDIDSIKPISKDEAIYSAVYYDKETESNYNRINVGNFSSTSTKTDELELTSTEVIVEDYEQGVGEKFYLNKRDNGVIKILPTSYEFNLVFYDPGRKISKDVVSNVEDGISNITLGGNEGTIYSTKNSDSDEFHGKFELVSAKRGGKKVLSVPEVIILKFKIKPELEYLFKKEEFNNITFSNVDPIMTNSTQKENVSSDEKISIPGSGGEIKTSTTFYFSISAILILLIIILSMVLVMFSEEREEYAQYKEEEKNKRKLAKKNK